MGKILARVTIFGIFLAGAIEASAQFAPFDSPPMGRLLRGFPSVQTSEHLSDRPTISCSNLRNSVAQILCSGREGAAADWAVNTATWAYLHHVGDAGKDAFEAEQTKWRNSVVQRCSLPALFDPTFVGKRESRCVVSMFQQRARQIRSRLPPEAVAEVNLTPEQRASIQQRLIDEGFLTGTADGEFGPATRQAIRQYQVSLGEIPTGYYAIRNKGQSGDNQPITSGSMRTPQQLLRGDPPRPSPGQQDNAALRDRIAQLEAQQEALRQEHSQELERERNIRNQIQATTKPSPPNDRVSHPASIGDRTSTDRSQVSEPPSIVPSKSGNIPSTNQSSGIQTIWVLLLIVGIVTLVLWQRISQTSSGLKLRLVRANVLVFSENDEPVLTFNNDLQAYLSGSDIELHSKSADQVARYSLSSDVKCLQILDEKERIAVGRTLARMTFTGIAWSMVRPRRNGNVGLGSALLDFRYWGSERKKSAEMRIVFRDLSEIIIDCDEREATSIPKSIDESTASDKASKDFRKESELLQRMVKDGPRILPQLRTEIAKIKEAIKLQQELSENAETFHDRDQARQELERLRDELAVPQAVLFKLSSQLPVIQAA